MEPNKRWAQTQVKTQLGSSKPKLGHERLLEQGMTHMSYYHLKNSKLLARSCDNIIYIYIYIYLILEFKIYSKPKKFHKKA